MSYPLLLLSQGCCHTMTRATGKFDQDEIHKGDLNCTGKILAASVIFDVCLVLTTLVLAILGGISVVPMPTPAFHALLGIGIGTIALWIGATIYYGGDNMKLAASLINGAGIVNFFRCSGKINMNPTYV